MSEETFERVYQEHLEERIIECLSVTRGIHFESALDVYYHCKLAD